MADSSHPLKLLPNQITLFRLIVIFFLIYLTFEKQRLLTGIGVAIIAPLDAIDGYLARTMKQDSSFGAKFDSFADYIGGIAAFYAYITYAPQMFTHYYYLLIVPALFLFLYLLASIIRQGRICVLHNYLGKLSAILHAAFLLYLLFLSFSPLFMHIVSIAFTINFLEKIFIVTLKKNPDPNLTSIFSKNE